MTIRTIVNDNVAIRCDGCREVIPGTPWRVNLLDIVAPEVAVGWTESTPVNPGPAPVPLGPGLRAALDGRARLPVLPSRRGARDHAPGRAAHGPARPGACATASTATTTSSSRPESPAAGCPARRLTPLPRPPYTRALRPANRTQFCPEFRRPVTRPGPAAENQCPTPGRPQTGPCPSASRWARRAASWASTPTPCAAGPTRAGFPRSPRPAATAGSSGGPWSASSPPAAPARPAASRASAPARTASRAAYRRRYGEHHGGELDPRATVPAVGARVVPRGRAQPRGRAGPPPRRDGPAPRAGGARGRGPRGAPGRAPRGPRRPARGRRLDVRVRPAPVPRRAERRGPATGRGGVTYRRALRHLHGPPGPAAPGLRRRPRGRGPGARRRGCAGPARRDAALTTSPRRCRSVRGCRPRPDAMPALLPAVTSLLALLFALHAAGPVARAAPRASSSSGRWG